MLDRTLNVAPMMDWTDRHCRFFHRQLAPSALLYTEMVTTGAVLHGDRVKLLGYSEAEHPVALQLGGSEPAELARSAKIAEALGYDEVNLNVGCPSDRVQKGRFGACLMLEPELVRDCLAAMADAVSVPVSVKSRLGADDHYSYGYFRDFAGTVMASGCRVFIAHARKAVLDGLSPKQNREVPPLHHDWVYRLKRELPDLTVVINGGIGSVTACREHLEHVDGVMLGRAAYHTPWLLAECERELCSGRPPESREALLQALNDYLVLQVHDGVPVKRVTRHLLGLFQGRPGAKAWRRYLSENAHLDDDNVNILRQALAALASATAGARNAA